MWSSLCVLTTCVIFLVMCILFRTCTPLLCRIRLVFHLIPISPPPPSPFSSHSLSLLPLLSCSAITPILTRQAEDELRRMENVRSQRLDMLQRRDRHTYDAINWLRENQHLFSQPILEPMAVSVNIKDRRYVAQVEALLGGRDFYSFVAQNEQDRETFLKEVRLKLSWLNV